MLNPRPPTEGLNAEGRLSCEACEEGGCERVSRMPREAGDRAMEEEQAASPCKGCCIGCSRVAGRIWEQSLVFLSCLGCIRPVPSSPGLTFRKALPAPVGLARTAQRRQLQGTIYLTPVEKDQSQMCCRRTRPPRSCGCLPPETCSVWLPPQRVRARKLSPTFTLGLADFFPSSSPQISSRSSQTPPHPSGGDMHTHMRTS